MIYKIRPLILLPIILSLTACHTFTPLLNSTAAVVPTILNSPVITAPLPTDTVTPHPSITPTPPLLLPVSSPTQVSSYTPTPTQIPLLTQLSIFENLWTIVNDTYVYPDFNGLDWNAVHTDVRQKITTGLTNAQFYQAMDQIITQLGDDHSFFLNPHEVATQEAEVQGKFDYVGIGVIVSAVPERHIGVILSVFPGSPADLAGLKPRDSIIAVDGTQIIDAYGYLRDIVRGPLGTTINIIVQTPGQDTREIQLTRQRINGDYPLVHNVILTPQGKKYGYILLTTFMDDNVTNQVSQALLEMTADAHLDGLILDDRMNGGGSSTVFEPVLSYFLGGKLGYFLNHGKQQPLLVKLDDQNGSAKVPLVVLVGSGTASFGEIFAGILQDMGRAYLIGKTTDGNVEILWGYDLEDGSQLWLANETFRPLNHPEQDWEKTGIVPNLTVSSDFDQYSLNNDPAVLAAIQYFSEQ